MPSERSEMPDEQAIRVDLAAVFRLCAEYDWHESVANHLSAAVSADGRRFLMNARWQHFSTVKASDLLLLDADDEATMTRPDAPDPSAWCIHSALHAKVPQARVLLHLHPPYATALSGLVDPTIKPIDQNTARFYNRCAVDLGFDGIADNAAEGERLARVVGNHSVLMMGNHGVSVMAPTVAEAFHDLYYLERACKTMVLAYSTGQPLSVMPDALAEKTAAGWDDYADMAFAFFDAEKARLDAHGSTYSH